MQIKKKIILFFLLIIFPYSLLAWGDGEKQGNGSCKFDLKTGYQHSSVYIKNHESFVIVDGGDSRYGTMSTIYDALSCNKVTSGEKYKSDFAGVMERKGFIEITLDNKYTIDKSFQNKITFSENSDEIIIHIEPIDSSTTEELTTLISSVSNMGVNSQINISNSTREFLSYPSFFIQLFEKLNSLPKTEINYNYALSLIDKLQQANINIDSSKGVLLAKQKELKIQIAKVKKETNDKFFTSHVKSIKDVPLWMDKMIQLGKKDIISNYILNIMNLSDFGKNLNPNNFLTSIEYRYILKDLHLKNVGKLKQYGNYYGIYLEYPNKTIRLTLTPTCHKTGQTSTSEFSCGLFWVDTCVGTYAEYQCKGKTSKIAQIEQYLVGTQKVATELSKGWKYDHQISRYTKGSSSSSSDTSSYCFGSGVREGDKNICLANVKRDSTYCFASGISEGDKNVCLATTKGDSTYCFGSGVGEGDKNVCLAITKGDSTYCFGSGVSEGDKNICLAITKGDSTYCFGSGVSEGDKNVCLAQTK